MSSPSLELNHTLVRAGAGAGKTTSLVNEVVRLAREFLKAGQMPRFVITTFTKKAANELKERLLLKALELDDEVLAKTFRSSSQLQVSTIHGVLSLFLNSYGSEIGLLPGFKVISNEQDFLILKKILKNHLANGALKSLLKNYRFAEILELVHELIQLQLENPQLEAFSEDELLEMIFERKKLFFDRAQKFAQMMRATTDKKEWLEVAESLEGFSLQQQVPESLKFPVNRGHFLSPELEELRDRIKEDLEELNSESFSTSLAFSHSEVVSELHQVLELSLSDYLKNKISKNVITLRNIENFSKLVVDRFPTAAQKFSENFDYWFVDEFQDTSPLQEDLIKKLMGDRKGYFVGDPQQSIYLFRGAKVELFENLAADFKAQGRRILTLDTNYRSERTVLEFINRVSVKMGKQPMQVGSDLAKLNEPVQVLVCDEGQEEQAVASGVARLLQQGVPAHEVAVLAGDNESLQRINEVLSQKGLPVFLSSAGKFHSRREVLDCVFLLKVAINPHDNLSLVSCLRSPVMGLSDAKIALLAVENPPSLWTVLQTSQDEEIQQALTKLKKLRENCHQQGFLEGLKSSLVELDFFSWCDFFDSTGRAQANTWKFLSLLGEHLQAPGAQALQFVEDFSQGDEESSNDAVPAVSSKRIQLMTVHGSKGLQFGHLFLFNLHKKVQTLERDLLLFDRDSQKWTVNVLDPRLGKKFKTVAGLQIQAQATFQKTKEHDRLLYVALTRAQKSLTLVTSKVSKNSWSETLFEKVGLSREQGEYQLAGVPYVVRCFEEVDGHWRTSENLKIKVEQLQPRELVKKVFSATDLLQVTAHKAASKRSNTFVEDLLRAQKGIEVHGILEKLKYFGWDHVKESFSWLSQVESGILKEVLSSGEVEMGFLAQFENSQIQGQIDLWGRDRHGNAWIIDYKTGSSLYQEKAFQQLAVYAWGLRKIKKATNTEPINIMAIFLGEKKIIQNIAPDLIATEAILRQSLQFALQK